MEKQIFQSQFSSQQHSQTDIYKKINVNVQQNVLYNLIPYPIKAKYSDNGPTDSCLYNCLINLHNYSKVEDLKDLFNQMGVETRVWENKTTSAEKTAYILEALQKNIEQSLKKVNIQANNYVNSIINKRQQSSVHLQKSKGQDFDWLNLNTKNEMLKSKLKTKLVQTINQFKNEKKLRQVMGRQLEQEQKIHLQDDSIDLFQDQKSKINYQWTQQDQDMFLNNIKKLKQKFTQTPFLKNCQRYKFITNSQIKTLACEQISRKLDKSNKAFLSRQFLLDKYFSTNQNLTQKQMKYILKTSPLLSKCVDKAFVRAAIKNIKYQDIDKMQLQIAQQIIQRFEMIRSLVKNSRKFYKQNQNNRAKRKIKQFQKVKRFQQTRSLVKDKLQVHKVKMIRNLNFRPNSVLNSEKKNIKNKQNCYESVFEADYEIPQKMIWPIPLNNHHPSTGLFIKDCSEQLNDQLNQYQKNYLKSVFVNNKQNEQIKRNNETKSAMVKFYTGGPLENCYTNRNIVLTSTNSFNKLERKKQGRFGQDVIKKLCQAFKTAEYNRQILGKLNTFDIDEQMEQSKFQQKNTWSISKSITEYCTNQFTKRTKKSEQQDYQLSSGKKVSNQTQKAIKDKIIQGRQKSKMTVYVKKLLSLAAQNSFLPLKALNIKFTASQVNSMDGKGNTALFYATKHKNADFIDYLMGMRADVNIRCQKGTTPLHNAFKSNNYSIICKCLTGPNPPNLNALDDELKTPLAYCCRRVLQMLGLQAGVVSVLPNQKIKFNNNSLLCINSDANNPNQQLQLKLDIKRANNSKQGTITCM